MLAPRRAAIVVLLALVAAAIVFASQWDRPHEVAYVVPAGTAARIASGETVSVLPSEIQLRTGDTLVVRNDDTEAVQIGPFRVDPGQRLSHRYRTAGTYDLVCSVHPKEALRIVVR